MIYNYLELDVLISKNDNLDTEENIWSKAIINLDFIYHFFEYEAYSNTTALCNYDGNIIFIVKIPYDDFKTLFLNYKIKNTIPGKN